MSPALVLALSLSSEVTKIGAIAGFAALPGIALLALLFFAQAREVKRLREWAGRAPERAREVEEQAQRAAAESRARRPTDVGTAMPVGAPAAATAAPALAGAPAAAAPAAPPAAAAPGGASPARPPFVLAGVGVGAPPLLSATRFRAPARSPGPAKVPAPAARRASAPGPAPVVTALARTQAPVRATAAGNGHAGTPAPATAVGAARAASAASSPSPPVAPPSPRGAARPAPAPPVSTTTRSPRRRLATGVLVAVGLLATAALAFGAIQLLSGDTSGGTTAKRGPNGAPTTAGRSKRGSAAFSNSAVTVSVLNGTPVAGLAKRVADQLNADGFKPGTVTNASEQTRAATIVSFLPGRRRAGRVVARSLKGRIAVAPIDATTRAIACPGPQPCSDVVVTVGADRAG